MKAILSLNTLDKNTFQATHHQKNFRDRLYGGQVVAQALVAAMRTVKGQNPHSLHAYFLHAGTTLHPITYHVEHTRDGRSVMNRAVKAEQNGLLLYQMMCSFHIDEEGYNHQAVYPTSSQPPEELLKKNGHGFTPQSQKLVGEHRGPSPLDYVAYDNGLNDTQAREVYESKIWVKPKDSPSQKEQHYGALAFTSDIGLLATALLPHPTSLFAGDLIPASMDHAIWFHHTPQFDQWHQFVTTTPWAGKARCLCSGFMYNTQNTLIATVTQEGLIRPKNPL